MLVQQLEERIVKGSSDCKKEQLFQSSKTYCISFHDVNDSHASTYVRSFCVNAHGIEL